MKYVVEINSFKVVIRSDCTLGQPALLQLWVPYDLSHSICFNLGVPSVDKYFGAIMVHNL